MAFNKEIYHKLTKELGFTTKFAKNLAGTKSENYNAYIKAVKENNIPAMLLENKTSRESYFNRTEGKRKGDFSFKSKRSERSAKIEYIKKEKTVDTNLTMKEINKAVKNDWKTVQVVAKDSDKLLDRSARNYAWSMWSSRMDNMRKSELKMVHKINLQSGRDENAHYGFAVMNHVYVYGWTVEEAMEHFEALSHDEMKYD